MPRSIRLLAVAGSIMMLGGCFDEESGRSSHQLVAERTAPPQLSSMQASAPAGAKMQESVAADTTGDAQRRIEERRSYDLRYGEATPLREEYRAILSICSADDACQVENSAVQNPRQGLASASLNLRLAREAMAGSGVIALIEASPALESAQVHRDDRSRQMIDLQARLEQQEALRDRLMELARQGREFDQRSINDLLQVERELARVQGQIESMRGQMNHLAHVTDTVLVQVRQREQRWAERRDDGPLAPLWRALERSVSLFFESLGQVVLVVVFLTPWLVLGIPLLWTMTKVWKRVRLSWRRFKANRVSSRKT
ncbi:DUF4349 domain-containing protein [Halomonas sp. YLGW01]|uniref:DUF4349 domain-containing protein n=1 Tax=Halomonas sp. YLGW01 TaxID=2773308 RepID=UPI00177E1F51|nr:DUF4349 domain-containing protein [Halomonas sp. YLGW01]